MTKRVLFWFLIFMVFANLVQEDNVKKNRLKIDEEMPCSVMSFSSSKSDIVRVFAPQKLADSRNQDFYVESQLLKL